MKTYKVICYFKPVVYTVISEDEAQAEYEAQKRLEDEQFFCTDMSIEELNEDD
jgi:hypothetical protein